MVNALYNFFVWATELYNHLFADFLHIHFAVRTLILLFMVWLIVYGAAQIFQYAAGPLLVLFYYHVLFRFWNYLLVETPQEWIYIRFYSEDKSLFRQTYLRLCDRVKANRMVLAHTRYMGIIYKGNVRRIARRLMVIGLILGSLWVGAFGLFNEYGGEWTQPPGSMAAATADAETEKPVASVTPEPEEARPTAAASPAPTETPAGNTGEAFPNPSVWTTDTPVTLYLNPYGADGANIRDLPGTQYSTVLEAVWGDIALEYMHEYAVDTENDAVYWLKVRAPSGTVGYISSTLLETE